MHQLENTLHRVQKHTKRENTKQPIFSHQQFFIFILFFVSCNNFWVTPGANNATSEWKTRNKQFLVFVFTFKKLPLFLFVNCFAFSSHLVCEKGKQYNESSIFVIHLYLIVWHNRKKFVCKNVCGRCCKKWVQRPSEVYWLWFVFCVQERVLSCTR